MDSYQILKKTNQLSWKRCKNELLRIQNWQNVFPGHLFRPGRLLNWNKIPSRMLIQDRTSIRNTRVGKQFSLSVNICCVGIRGGHAHPIFWKISSLAPNFCSKMYFVSTEQETTPPPNISRNKLICPQFLFHYILRAHPIFDNKYLPTWKFDYLCWRKSLSNLFDV